MTTFHKTPVRFRMARHTNLGKWPDDLDAKRRPLVHVAAEISEDTYAYRTFCGQVIEQKDLERFAGNWKVTCTACTTHKTWL